MHATHGVSSSMLEGREGLAFRGERMRVTRLGAFALASSLALAAMGGVQADDVPAAQTGAVTNHHLAVLAVEGMT